MFVYVIYWATLSGIPILRTALEKPNWFEWSAGLQNLSLQCFTGEGKLGKVRIIGTEFPKTESSRNWDSTVYWSYATRRRQVIRWRKFEKFLF